MDMTLFTIRKSNNRRKQTMKNKSLKTVFVLSVLSLSCLYGENLHLFKCNGKYGYVTDSLNVSIPPSYDYAEEFSGGYAITGSRHGTKKIYYTLIDTDNNIPDSFLCNCKRLRQIYKNIYSRENEQDDGYLLYNMQTKQKIEKNNSSYYTLESDKPSDLYISTSDTDNGAYFMSLDGKEEILHGNWKRLYPLSDGAAFAVLDNFDQVIINKKGDYILQNVADSDWCFSEGLLAVETDKISGYIDNTGKLVFSCPFEPVNHEFYPPGLRYPFREDAAAVQIKNDIYRIYDRKGHILMNDTAFFDCQPCSNGLFRCRKVQKGKYGFIDKTGIYIIPPALDDAESFHDGYAIVMYKGRDGLLGRNGNLYFADDLIAGNRKSMVNIHN
jgi:hypothetical protein